MFTDDLAPNNGLESTLGRFLALWKRVLTLALLDACKNQTCARTGLIWANSADGKLVCQYAGIDYETVRLTFRKIYLSETERKRYLAMFEKNRPKVTRRKI